VWRAEAREGFLVQLLSLPEIVMEALVIESVGISNQIVCQQKKTWYDMAGSYF
jgi:hypothetical protein